MAEFVYKVLTLEEQHDMLLNTLIAQERDHYMHCCNAERFRGMLDNALQGQETEFAQRIQKLHDDTLLRRHEVETIMHELLKQMPSEEHTSRAIQRLRLKEEDSKRKRQSWPISP